MGRPVYGYVVDGYWQDIGNLTQYRQANFDALDGRVKLEIPGVRLRGNIWLGKASRSTTSIGSRRRRSSATTVGSRRTQPSVRTPFSRPA